jgi:acyl-CoA synthetase (AMP-forming)/AMP-acid ligase II/acyl carrier protein
MNKIQRFVSFCLYYLIKGCLALRYRIKIKGLDALKSAQMNPQKGILFLPNHPAELDPVILMMVLWRDFHPRPLVVEHFFYLNGVQFFMDLVGALPLPNLNGGTNQWQVRQVEKLLKRVEEGLDRKENFLIYPAGRLKLTEEEIIGASSFVHNLVTDCPGVNVVLIRTKGLWGSLFSRAITGEVPDFGRTLFQGMKILLKNGIFFAPKREIEIEMTPAPADFPYSKPRLEFNRYLENWYDTPKDALRLVSFTFWKKTFPQVYTPREEKIDFTKIKIDPLVEKDVLEEVSRLSKRPLAQIQRQMRLSQDLGFDSLDMAQIGIFLELKHDVGNLPPNSIQTVEDLLYAASGYKREKKEKPPSSKALKIWQRRERRPEPEPPRGKTLQEAFLNSSDRMRGMIACGDALSGVLTYGKLKLTALILSRKIEAMPGKYVGILLPSSAGAYAVILATLLAKKIPVMLNWTAGKRALDHALELTQFDVVLTSYRFLSRLENADLGQIEEHYLFLEDVKKKIALKEKLYGLYLSFKKSPALSRKLLLDNIQEEDPAVILFTSGTETLPKGVPLTHRNLLSNQRAALECVHLMATDSLYGILPPFHSFGFSVTGILPLLTGLKVFYAPDPTDSLGLTRDIFFWKLTLFCAAPSFIAAVFRVAKPEQLGSLRLVVSGAEMTPTELFAYVEKLGKDKRLLEGYGITECSPIVTLDRPERPHKGVGQPLPGIELCVIDPETHRELPLGEEGEICIHGPSVFNGYLGKDVPSPLIELKGKKWYHSGDRGNLDPDGTLLLSGRLKRFIKIGGEMVSLGGLEAELLKLAKEKNWGSSAEGPPLAISAKEQNGEKAAIVLFTTFDISKDEVNTALKENGFSRIAKIAEVKKIPQIPLTGTGKTHYRLLDESL